MSRVQPLGRVDPHGDPGGTVLIAYGDPGSMTKRATDLMAQAVRAQGRLPLVKLLDQVTEEDVRAADHLLVGCRARTRYRFGGPPVEQAMRCIGALPPLDGKRVGVFCTYRFFPHTFADTVTRVSETLYQFKRGLEEKGAVVVADEALHRRTIADSTESLVQMVVGSAPAR